MVVRSTRLPPSLPLKIPHRRRRLATVAAVTRDPNRTPGYVRNPYESFARNDLIAGVFAGGAAGMLVGAILALNVGPPRSARTGAAGGHVSGRLGVGRLYGQHAARGHMDMGAAPLSGKPTVTWGGGHRPA
jgi:hypothetical protein